VFVCLSVCLSVGPSHRYMLKLTQPGQHLTRPVHDSALLHEGRQRVVTCRQSMVSSRLCNDPKPTNVEVCDVACANDCVTSQWSDWSSCSRTCSMGRVAGHRTRYRDILAHAGQGILGQYVDLFATAEKEVKLESLRSRSHRPLQQFCDHDL